MSLSIGFLSFLFVAFLSIEKGTYGLFFQVHSLIIVLGGTAALLIFANPTKTVKELFKATLALFKKEDSAEDFTNELLELARSGDLSQPSKHELIEYARQLWESGVEKNLFIVLVSQKRNELEGRLTSVVQALKNLSKYPPALGMLGTVMGMVALFSSLDTNKDQIGLHLSVAMTATFYGLILANGLIQPLADRLTVKKVESHKTLNFLYEIILLINRKEAFELIQGEISERAG